MSKKFAGKTFSTPEEAGITSPTEEEVAHAREVFDDLQEQVDRVPGADRLKEISRKFSDDTSGIEFEGWQDR